MVDGQGEAEGDVDEGCDATERTNAFVHSAFAPVCRAHDTSRGTGPAHEPTQTTQTTQTTQPAPAGPSHGGVLPVLARVAAIGRAIASGAHRVGRGWLPHPPAPPAVEHIVCCYCNEGEAGDGGASDDGASDPMDELNELFMCQRCTVCALHRRCLPTGLCRASMVA